MAFKSHLEPLSPAKGDGATLVFSTSVPYVAGSFTGIVRGLPRVAGNDDGYVETSPALGTVTFKEAPEDDDDVLGHFLEEVADGPGTVIEEISGSIRDIEQLGGTVESVSELKGQILPVTELVGTIEPITEISGTLNDVDQLAGTLEDC